MPDEEEQSVVEMLQKVLAFLADIPNSRYQQVVKLLLVEASLGCLLVGWLELLNLPHPGCAAGIV